MNYVEVTDQKESLNTKTRKNRNQKKEAMSRVPESRVYYIYLTIICQYNLEYLKKYRLEHDQSALEWLIFNNTNLVHKIIGRYTKFYHHKLDYDDLFSVGLEGLML